MRIRVILALIACTIAVEAGPTLIPMRVLAQSAPAAAAKGDRSDFDPAATLLRDRIVRAYRDLRSLHELVSQRQWTGTADGATTINFELRFRRPNRLYLAIDYPNVDGPGRWELVYACDGKTLTVYNSALDEYQSVRAPARLDRLALPQSLRGPEFAALLHNAGPFNDVDKSAVVRYSESAESGEGGAWRTLRIDLQRDGARRSLRYRLGPRDNLVHGLSLSIVPDAGTVNPFADPVILSSVDATYSLVEAHARFGDADFRFVPPAGARETKAGTTLEEHAGRARGSRDEEPPR
jgi:hypothetical protein